MHLLSKKSRGKCHSVGIYKKNYLLLLVLLFNPKETFLILSDYLIGVRSVQPYNIDIIEITKQTD